MSNFFSKNYTDLNTNLNLPNALIYIVNIIYVPENTCRITYNIFLDEQNFQNGKTPIFTNYFMDAIKGDPSAYWETYFATDVLAQANHDIVTQAVAFLQSCLTSA